MNKTNIDDVYISMISKDAEKIEERFSDGENLSSNDIHTLVLKTQYNHINHLDKKLDEVTETVKNLEHNFEKLEVKFEKLELNVKNEINQAIITQTKWLIGSAGVLIVGLKVLDIFAK